MTPIQNEEEITANGEYSMPELPPGRKGLLEWEVTAGTATVTPGYVSLSGVFRAAVDLTGEPPVFPAAAGVIEQLVPSRGVLVLKVENAVGLTMKVCQTLVRD